MSTLHLKSRHMVSSSGQLQLLLESNVPVASGDHMEGVRFCGRTLREKEKGKKNGQHAQQLL